VPITASRGNIVISMALGPLKRIPLFRVLAIAQVAMLVGEHVRKLSPGERRQLVALVRKARGRPGNLQPSEREELRSLVAKLEPGAFARGAARRVAPLRRRK
jgi:hypothetical protein